MEGNYKIIMLAIRVKNVITKLKIFILIFLLSTTAIANQTVIENVQLTQNQAKTRLIFSLTQSSINDSPIYRITTSKNPVRLTIEFQNSRSKNSIKKLNTQRTVIRSTNQIAQGNRPLRMVFNLADNTVIQSEPLKPSGKNKYQLIVTLLSTNNSSSTKTSTRLNDKTSKRDVVPTKEKSNSAVVSGFNKELRFRENDTEHSQRSKQSNLVKAQKNESKIAAKSSQVKIKPPKSASTHSAFYNKRHFVVVLDAGHGGKDSGAIGPRGTKEKDVVLRIAKLLKTYIDREPGMRAVLTRHSDHYVPLRQRLRIARKHNADLFISIHADAFIHPRSKGASIFALSPRGATSEAARWLAEKENYSELGGVSLHGLNDKSGVVRSVLIDLSQTATIGASLQLGNQILSNLNRVTTLHHARVEQAPFVVLKSPDIPSILIETGFISNPQEEAKLRDSRYWHDLAKAISSGIRKYAAGNSGVPTYLARR